MILDEQLVPVGADLGAAFLSPPAASAPVEVHAGQVLDVQVTVSLDAAGPLAGALAFNFGLRLPLRIPMS
ncbi:MAG: hypothetical protein R2705_04735 [Ilumatobacteraceae bacterium]